MTPRAVLLVSLFVFGAAINEEVGEAVVLGKGVVPGAGLKEASCGLEGIDTTNEPYAIPAIEDDLDANIRVWDHGMYGDVIGITVEASPHSPYMAASWSQMTLHYFLNTNNLTKDFVREQDTREMVRNVSILCVDGSSSRYTLTLGLRDFHPPQFEKDVYEVEISSEHSFSQPLRMTDGSFITVSDGAVEWGTGYSPPVHSSVPGLLRFETVRISGNVPTYRVYPFRAPNSTLTKGQEVRMGLSALDSMNAGVTILILKVRADL